MSSQFPRSDILPAVSASECAYSPAPTRCSDQTSAVRSCAIKDPSLDPQEERPNLAKHLPKVVILSDDRYFCALVRSYLESAGLCVFVCTTPDRAENLFLRRCGIDLWIIDVQALGIEAVYVATRVSELHPEVPILVIEGCRSDAALLRTFLPESWTLVKKPVEFPNLLASVFCMLASRPQQTGTRKSTLLQIDSPPASII